MHISKLLGIILILLSILFLGLQSKGLEVYAFGIRALAMVFLVVLYFIKVKPRHVFFTWFLLAFMSSEVFNYLTYDKFSELGSIDPYYLIGNVLYILAYFFLIARILSIMNLKKAISKFPLQILLLFGLGVFVVYMITDISKSELDHDLTYKVELFYNTVIMFLVCLSLVNYMYNDTKKAMNLLLGSICIVFSEVIQIAYYYITDYDNTLSVVYSVFLVGAFVFFYLQSRLTEKHQSIYINQELKA